MQDVKYWEERKIDDIHRDWKYSSKNWIDGYIESRFHSHRNLLISLLYKENFESLLEIGCNVGPNLMRINRDFPNVFLAGIDANAAAIKMGKSLLPFSDLRIEHLNNISFKEYFDIILVDAVLLYISPEQIDDAMDKITSLARKIIILIEWFDESPKGVKKDFHWARNYTSLLKERDFIVKEIPITENIWPSKNWIRNGKFFVAHRASQIGEKN